MVDEIESTAYCSSIYCVNKMKYWFLFLIVYFIIGFSLPVNAQITFPTGIHLVQAWENNNTGNGYAACTNNICTHTLTHPIAAGHTVVGYLHGANDADNAPMYAQSIKDQDGTSLNSTPPAEWTPFNEDIGVWYLTQVPETITSITYDFSQYNGTLNTGTAVDTGYAEYSGVQSLIIVPPAASNSLTPSLTITPTSRALIWTLGAFFVGNDANTDASLTTPGYSVIVSSAGNNIAEWGSNRLVPATAQTLTYNNPVGPPGDCADWAPDGCSAIIAAVVLQGGTLSSPPSISCSAAVGTIVSTATYNSPLALTTTWALSGDITDFVLDSPTVNSVNIIVANGNNLSGNCNTVQNVTVSASNLSQPGSPIASNTLTIAIGTIGITNSSK
jgi:hypothetical protein